MDSILNSGCRIESPRLILVPIRQAYFSIFYGFEIITALGQNIGEENEVDGSNRLGMRTLIHYGARSGRIVKEIKVEFGCSRTVKTMNLD